MTNWYYKAAIPAICALFPPVIVSGWYGFADYSLSFGVLGGALALLLLPIKSKYALEYTHAALVWIILISSAFTIDHLKNARTK